MCAVARGMLRGGARVTLVTGGLEVASSLDQLALHEEFRVVRLPTLVADVGEVWRLVTLTKRPLNPIIEQSRRQLLLDTLLADIPAAIVLEMFPFGRRRFHFELEPLLDKCYELQRRPLLFSSVRDLLVKQALHEQVRATETIMTYFDHVLVHSDKSIVNFVQHNGPGYRRIEPKFIYTGYVHRLSSDMLESCNIATAEAPCREVIITAGGGGSGNVDRMFKIVAQARTLCQSRAKTALWRFRAGQRISPEDFDSWKSSWASNDGICLERNDSDFTERLKRCKCVISQGGYNTISEVLATGGGNKMIVVPIAPGPRGKDTEQQTRAKLLVAQGAIAACIPAIQMEAPRVAAAVDAVFAAAHSHTSATCIDLSGANVCATRVLDLVHESDAVRSRNSPAALPITQVCRGVASPASPVTVLLLNFRRPENLRRILGDLERQTVKPDVFLWNNSGNVFTDPRVSWQLDSSENRFCWPRWMMGSLAKTKYVCTMDDDLTFADPRVLEDAIAQLESHNSEAANTTTIAGFTGCVLHPDQQKPYEDGFMVHANKFPWTQATQLPWQEGIIYSSQCTTDMSLACEREEIDSRVYRRKPWHAVPSWIDVPTGTAAPSASIINMQSDDTRLDTSSPAQSSPSRPVAFAQAITVDIVKGRLMLTRSDALRGLKFAFDRQDIRGDDIAVSGMLSDGKRRQHLVLRVFAGRVLELPAPFALCRTPGSDHYSRRDAVRRRFFDH